MVCCRGLKGLVVPGCRLEGEKARDFEEVELAVAGLGHAVSGDVGVHEVERLLLLLFPSILGLAGDAVGPALIVARVEVLVVELAQSVAAILAKSHSGFFGGHSPRLLDLVVASIAEQIIVVLVL